MLQWILRFSEFAELIEFYEISAPFRKNPNRPSIYKLENFHASVLLCRAIQLCLGLAYLKKKDGGTIL